jgi:hypothetical protein
LVKKYFPTSALIQTKKIDDTAQWCLILSKEDISDYYNGSGIRIHDKNTIDYKSKDLQRLSAKSKGRCCGFCACLDMCWWLFKVMFLLFLIVWAVLSYLRIPYPTNDVKENYGKNAGSSTFPAANADHPGATPTHIYQMEQNDFVTGKSTYTEYLAKQQQKPTRSP